MLFVESNWDMWNTPLRAEGQRDAVHKCWCYCRNSRSFSFWTQLKHPNSESWLWKFGKLNHLISGWGKEGTLWSRTVLGIKRIKKDCEMLYCILIFLNCMGSWGVLPLACKSNLNTFRLFDLYDPICMYMYIYIHTRGSLSLICSHTCISCNPLPQASLIVNSTWFHFMIIYHFLSPKKKHHLTQVPAVVHWACRTQDAKLGGLGAVASPAHGTRDGQPSIERTRSWWAVGKGNLRPFWRVFHGLPDFWDLKSGIYWHCQIPAAILLVSSGSDMECHQVNTLGE